VRVFEYLCHFCLIALSGLCLWITLEIMRSGVIMLIEPSGAVLVVEAVMMSSILLFGILAAYTAGRRLYNDYRRTGSTNKGSGN